MQAKPRTNAIYVVFKSHAHHHSTDSAMKDGDRDARCAISMCERGGAIAATSRRLPGLVPRELHSRNANVNITGIAKLW